MAGTSKKSITGMAQVVAGADGDAFRIENRADVVRVDARPS